MVPAPKYQHARYLRDPQRQTGGGAVVCWGRSANCAKRGGAKCSGLQEGHPLPMGWGQGGHQGGGGSSAVPCGGQNGPCKGLEAGMLGLQWRPWLQSQ